MGRSIELDSSRFPLVVATFDGAQTAEDLDRYLTTFDAVHARKKPFVLAVRLRKYSTTGDLRDRMGAWMKKCEPLTRDYCVCTAIITESMGFRFVLSSVFLIKPLITPYKVCANETEAMQFIRGEAQKRNLALPDGLSI
jgi:hypothetical protein